MELFNRSEVVKDHLRGWKLELCLTVFLGGFLLMPAASLGSWRVSATGSSGSPPQIVQEQGTPEEDRRCSRPDV